LDKSNQKQKDKKPYESDRNPSCKSDETNEKSDEIAMKIDENPAVYLAQTAVEKTTESNLHLGPLDVHQQKLFQQTLDENEDLCAKSQTEIGRTNIIKHKILTGDSAPTAQALVKIYAIGYLSGTRYLQYICMMCMGYTQYSHISGIRNV
jgi:hypothetical protein